jgi:aryl-alcohol dehydrogenase-like predicted oxidoreductase
MKTVKFGHTGLEVSRLCLGCMSYGVPDRGAHPWSLGEADSRPFIRRALDLGINFFDTANVYSDGTSEEIVGRALLDYARRDDVVIATKVHGRMRPGPNGAGLSRKAILAEIDASLRRLGTDHVDLYQIHRWDPGTPIEETLEALHDVVKAGKARYLGASSMYAWQFAKALKVAERRGWTRFVSMQNYLNLLYREEEREMLPLCRDEGIAVMPWSPLARGRLTRDWDAATARSETDAFGRTLYPAATAEADRAVVAAVGQVATARGVPRAQVALAWVLQTPGVAAPIVGATRLGQLDDAVAALSLELTADEIAALERPYRPHPVLGHA